MLKHNFTLVELLVVVAILSILAALLLPTLQDAIENAQSVVCANNLRTISLAMDNYAEDHSGAFAKMEYWRRYYCPYLNVPVWNTWASVSQMPSVFICVAGKQRLCHTDWRTAKQNNILYRPGMVPYSVSNYPKRSTSKKSIFNPSSCMLVWCAWSNAWDDTGASSCGVGNWGHTLTPSTHSVGRPIAYADLHVETIGVLTLESPSSAIDPNNDGKKYCNVGWDTTKYSAAY